MESTQPLTEMSTRDIYWRVEAAGANRRQPCHFHEMTIWNFWKPLIPAALRACPGLHKESFAFEISNVVHSLILKLPNQTYYILLLSQILIL
jgi:hypothetical protein